LVKGVDFFEFFLGISLAQKGAFKILVKKAFFM
jgi:hypothetical protein